jgi:hypothetical protein
LFIPTRKITIQIAGVLLNAFIIITLIKFLR